MLTLIDVEQKNINIHLISTTIYTNHLSTIVFYSSTTQYLFALSQNVRSTKERFIKLSENYSITMLKVITIRFSEKK